MNNSLGKVIVISTILIINIVLIVAVITSVSPVVKKQLEIEKNTTSNHQIKNDEIEHKKEPSKQLEMINRIFVALIIFGLLLVCLGLIILVKISMTP